MTLAGMPLAEPLGDENVDRLPEQFLAWIPKEPLGLRIHEHDGAVRVDDDHCVGRRFEQPAKQ